MKTKQILKALPVMFSLTAAFGQTAAERLEQGVQLQSAEGDLKGAIAEYKEVLKSAAKSQRLAAEARYRLAECFSQLGNVERMKDHLKALREDFPADNKWVLKAISMAPKDWAFEGTPWQDGTIHTYEVRIPNGNVMGHFLLATRLLEKSPAK